MREVAVINYRLEVAEEEMTAAEATLLKKQKIKNESDTVPRRYTDQGKAPPGFPVKKIINE